MEYFDKNDYIESGYDENEPTIDEYRWAKSFRRDLQQVIIDRHTSIKEIAKCSGISIRSMERIYDGDQYPSTTMLMRLCIAFDWDLSDVIGDTVIIRKKEIEYDDANIIIANNPIKIKSGTYVPRFTPTTYSIRDDEWRQRIASNLRDAIETRNISKSKLADICNIHRSMMIRYTDGTSDMQPWAIVRICKILRIPMRALLIDGQPLENTMSLRDYQRL